MIVRHDIDCACYTCKLRSLNFDRGRPKTHVKRGDPWDGNPVKERIDELQKEGKRVTAFEMSSDGSSAPV